MQLLKLSEFRKKYFAPGSEPDIKTIKSDIDNADLPGMKIGTRYYIDVDRLHFSTSDNVMRILNAPKETN